MPPSQHNVVVTGAAGFVGSHLCRALVRQGVHVVGIDNFDTFYDRALKVQNVNAICNAADTSASSRFTLVEADIRDAEKLREVFAANKPAAVFHIAALAGVLPSIADPARYAAVNVDGLICVLDAARAVECCNIIFASSSSVYGNNRKVPFAETDSVDEPISPYAATKRAGELICHTYAHLFKMRIAALRFFTVYGPAQRPDLAICKFMQLIAAGQSVPMFGDGSTSRDYTYIDDIVQGVLAASTKISNQSNESFFRIWNLGNSHPISLAELIDSVAHVVGRPAQVNRLPLQAGDVEHTWADIARSRNELGYEPRTPFEEGLKRQWQWMREIPTLSAVSAPAM